MQALVLILAEFKYKMIFQKRYCLNFYSGLVNLTLFLIFLQFGISSFQGTTPNQIIYNRLSSLIVGFFVFNMVFTSIGAVSFIIGEGATTGTLEQTMLSYFGTENVFFIKAFVSSIFDFFLYAFILPLSMIICRHFFEINFFKLFCYMIPLWMSSWGLGFAIGAATIIYKKTSNFTNLIQFLVLSLIVLPSYPLNLYSFLPISPSAMTINKVFASGLEASWSWIGFLYLHGLIYLILGMVVFKRGEQYARDKGTLGQY